MTDRESLALVFCFITGMVMSFLWSEGFRPGAILVGLIIGGFIWDWLEEAKPDEVRRPVLTIFAELASIVGGIIAVAALINK
ncbi:hypothetical protein AB0G74_16420 [Streptomyces sp. NPDC020875]|uniref:hypothetical protein n=1 Tax=Streptomyces sp. NPDC020875 TaxID=3154898 RepID=UPI0033E702DC